MALVDQRGPAPRWTGLVVCDDRIETIKAAEDAHRLRWAAWLAWSNVIQFLADDLSGDAGQLAYSTLDSFDPATLEAADSTGILFAHRLKPIDPDSADWLGRQPIADTSPAPAAQAPPSDARWRRVLDLISPEESGLESLVHGLAARGAPLPTVGYELGDDGWQAELAWPEARVAVVLGQHHGLSASHVDERDRAFAAAGWHARAPHQWTIDELLLHIGKA
ncbi:MAG: hypothetical protein IRY85_19655 [Micromonosporaceae bacterium]|nr:hypothetical protein [Micromonosporaceae bacterium]